MQYDLAATIHFGPWSRFNEFLLSCMCVSLGLALSFDPHHHQCISKRHRLALQNEDVEPLQERYLALYYVFDFFFFSQKSEEICPVNGTYWVCLFVCFFFTLNGNSNRIVTGRFPTILPGKLECSWIFEFLSFIKFGHLSSQFGFVTKKRACVHICSFQQFRPILLIYWRLDSMWWVPLDWTFLIIWTTWITFFFFFLLCCFYILD